MDKLLLSLPPSAANLILEGLNGRQLLALKSKFPDLVLKSLLKSVKLYTYQDRYPFLNSNDIIYSSKNIKVSLDCQSSIINHFARYHVSSGVTDAEIDASSQILSRVEYFIVHSYGWQPMEISTDRFTKILSHLNAAKLYFDTPAAEEKVYELNAEDIIAVHDIKESKAKFHFGDRVQRLSLMWSYGNPFKSFTFANVRSLKNLELTLYQSDLDINLIVPFYNLKTLSFCSPRSINGHNLAKLQLLEQITIKTEMIEKVVFPKSIISVSVDNLNFDAPMELENYPNLETLEIGYSRSPVLEMSNVPNLQTLKNPSITMLNCDKLAVTTLSITSQALSSGVIDLPHLETLDLYECDTEILDYSSCPKLKTLNIFGSKSTDHTGNVPLQMIKSNTLEILAIYTYIDEMLVIECPNLTDLTIKVLVTCDVSIEKCASLQRLNFVGLSFSESGSKFYASLKHLKNIKSIFIRKNSKVSSTKYFKNLTTLLNLDLIDVGLEDLEGIETLTSLQRLVIDSSKVKSLSDLPKSLQHLSCNVNRLTELDLSDLPELEFVNCSYGDIAKIRRLENLPRLNTLFLAYNNISDVEMIHDLPALNKLDLSYTKLEKLDPVKGFSNLPKLVQLDAYSSRIRYVGKLETLAGCHNLKTACLRENVLQSIDIDFAKIPQGTQFWLDFESSACLKDKSHLKLSQDIDLGPATVVLTVEHPNQ